MNRFALRTVLLTTLMLLGVAAVMSGAVDNPIQRFGIERVWIYGVAACALAAYWTRLFWIAGQPSLAGVCFSAFCAICAANLGIGELWGVGSWNGYGLFFLVMLLVGVTGKLSQVLFVWCLLSASEFAGSIGYGYENGLLQESGYPIDTLWLLVQKPIQVSIMCAVAGGVALAGSWARLRYHHEKVAPATHRQTGHSQTIVKEANPAEELAQSQLTRTQSFRLESAVPLAAQRGDLGDLLSSVVYFVSKNFKAWSALGFIYDPAASVFELNSFHSRSMSVIPGVRIPLGEGVVGQVGSQRHSFMSGDVSLYNAKTLYYSGNEHVNSILVVPVISDHQELVGALVIDSKDKNAFSDADKENLNRFSVFAAALISNVRMRVLQEQAALQLRTLYSASERFAHSLTEDELFDNLTSLLAELEGVSRVLGVALDLTSGSAQVKSLAGAAQEIPPGLSFGPGNGIYWQVIATAQPVVIDDYQGLRGQAFRFMENEPYPAHLRSLAVLPINDNQGRCRGVVSLESALPGVFHGQLMTILSTLTGNASVVLNRAQLYHQMETLATTDGLTGLYNHRHFQEQLAAEMQRAVRYKRPVSVLLLDIDHFKLFNDTYGHPVGDLVLKEISACILRSIRKTDSAARYGGEEFTVIMPETDLEHGAITPERIRTNIENQVIVSQGRQLRVTVSIGWSTFPSSAANQKELIDNADKALYYSKEQGRNRVSLYQPHMAASSKKK